MSRQDDSSTAPPSASPTTHELKTWPEYFDAVARGDKPFEIRKDDRGFAVGDLLVLRKFTIHGKAGQVYVTPEGWETRVPECADTIRARVSYLLRGMGIAAGYVALGLAGIEVDREGPS
jgi:hypothetical protein